MRRASFGLSAIVLMGLCFTAFSPPVYARLEGSSWAWLKHLVEEKEEYMGPVATKVVDLPETGYIWNLDFSPDGRYLAANDQRLREIHIWDLQGQGRIVRTLMKPGASETATNCLRYSPDGNMLANYSGRPKGKYVDLRIWDAKTGATVHDVTAHAPGGGQCGLAFSPDGHYLIWSSNLISGSQVMAQRTDTWEQVWGLATLPFLPEALGLSADGKLIAVGGYKAGKSGQRDVFQTQIRIIDRATRTVVRAMDAFPLDNGNITALSWNPDSIHVAVGTATAKSGEEAVKIFDVTTGKQVAGEPVEGADVGGLVYTPDGRYLVEAGIEKGVRIWDGQHRTLLQTIPISGYAVAASPDSRYIAIGAKGKISIWSINNRPTLTSDR